MKKRILSMMLAALMAFGSLGVLCTVPNTVAAEEGSEDSGEINYTDILNAALICYDTPEDKVATMRLAVEYGGYRLYVHDYSGEIAVEDTATGQILLSNPYNVPNNIDTSVRQELYSQIVIGYTDNTSSASAQPFYSYTEAAARGQIKVKNLKNGIRVEYTMGREGANYLAPGRITEERMIKFIFSKMDPSLTEYTKESILTSRVSDLKRLYACYIYVSVDEFGSYDNIPTSLKEPFYERDKSKTENDKRRIEDWIKTYCPEYTYEEMDKDHEQTGFVETQKDPPLFKLALEYTLSETGLQIRLPANSIRFNSELYSLEYVTPLQYFGAGNLDEDGYIFYPDGSGALLYYEDLRDKSYSSISGKVYGADYAYHVISGKHQEVIRMPVYGLVSERTIGETTERSGFFAILEEGETMSNITAAWGGSQHRYASVYPTFYPRPKDSYDLSGDVTAGSSDTTWTVESSRKYTGSYNMRIVMLPDASKEAQAIAGGHKYYAASYVGMARAYADYLENTAGVLTPLSSSDVMDGSIPLYIEAFGTVPDTQKFLSIPIDVDVALTTFENVKTMYRELYDNGNGIRNINFKLTGFANGGMYSTYPAKLRWMKEVGGDGGFSDLLADATEKGYGVYPDFNFMYVSEEKWFDGFDLRSSAARTIDNRYSSKKVYDATYQAFVSYFDICVTPVMVEEYYSKFSGAYSRFNPMGISVSTMGSDLNSDFGKKNPTNRAEAKEILSSVLGQVKEDYGSVMTSGGNIYALKYTEHLLNAALDSSRFTNASRSVPFVGMVLHGYVNFAGSAINMAGNVNYQVLKAIENGAGIYFTLSYDNTNLLKEFTDLSEYYSVNYKIWAGTYDENGNLVEQGEIFDVYNRVNRAIGDLQTSRISDHRFLIGERVASDAEKADYEKLYAKTYAEAKAALTKEAREALLDEYREQLEAGLIDPGMLIDPIISEEAVVERTLSMLPRITTTSEATADKADYEHTLYTLDDGMIVMVTYENGVSIILNYNVYAVTVTLNGTTYTLDAYGYVRI